MKTIDGGITWNPQWSGTNITRRSSFFIDNFTGWSAGGGGVITKTINGGSSWTLLNSGSSIDFASIFFVNPDTGWFTGQDKLYVTFDGGASWQNQLYQYDENFTDLWFEGPDLGWVVGYDGIIYKYDTTPKLHVLYPNGGEEYFVEQTRYIGWQSFEVDSITIEYSTDNGISWMIIVDSIPSSDENYPWEIPNTPSNECLVKISDINDPNILDLSDGNFSIIRSPQIISPNGGENLYFNQPYNLQWMSGGSENIKIELSRDNGNYWEVITDSTSGLSGNFSWVVTPPQSNQCLLKITDNEFPDFFDISNATFHIDTLILPYHYFPLTSGNNWFFKEYDETIYTILTAEKDTILNDGNSYAKINQYDRYSPNQNFQLSGTTFLRQEGDSVLRYPHSVVFNFHWQTGDTISNFLIIDTVYAQNVFGRLLTTYVIFITWAEYYTYSDGIGFNTLRASIWGSTYSPRFLSGCIIDGIQYGNILTSLYEKHEHFVEDYLLEQNYPNPFNSFTTISFFLPKAEDVIITIFDINGRKTAIILNGKFGPGKHSIKFDAERLASGIYYYRIKAGKFSDSKKFLYIK